jgi:eukaryotic-like serine/threonine-protein kinase
VQRYWLPTIRATIALQRGDAQTAIQLLGPAEPLELSQPTGGNVFLCPAYVRGQAYLALHDGAHARAEFDKFVNNRGLVANFPWGALARLGIARSYALEAAKEPAAKEKARAAYWEFLAMWKDADPEVPVLREAKLEYAKL